MKKKCIIWVFGSLAIALLLMVGRIMAEDLTPLTIMHPDPQTLSQWVEEYQNAPSAMINENISIGIDRASSCNLLNHISYIASQRNQMYCGNCWSWAGTGVLEVSLDVNAATKDRLSIQYLTSCYIPPAEWPYYPCCGGNLTYFRNFYAGKGAVLPWSNSNANWQDGNRQCSSRSSSIACSAIATTPSYPFLSISPAQTIRTADVSQDTAIANIKNVLQQNKAIYYGFYLANNSDWNQFFAFWNNQAETVKWNPDAYCGHTWINGQGGGHAVLCVGYVDNGGSDRYWIMLNSWGTTTSRPGGLFRLDMNMNYGCMLHETGYLDFGAHEWQTLDVTWHTSVCTLSCTATVPASAETGVAVPFSATASPSAACSDLPSYLWNFGDGATSTDQNTAHVYSAGTYNWSVTALVGGTGPCVRVGTIAIGTSSCSVSCTAVVPSTGQINSPVAFTATATPQGSCTGVISYSWNFGDGFTSTEQNPLHTYIASTIYAWSLTTTYSTAAPCTHLGAIAITSNGISLPDLTGSWSSVTNKGRSCRATLTCMNSGNAPSSGFKVRYYLSKSPVINSKSKSQKEIWMSPLGVGSSYALRLKTSVSSRFKNGYLLAIVDSNNSVTESDETNNTIVSGLGSAKRGE